MECAICGADFPLVMISKNRVSSAKRCASCRHFGRRYASKHGHNSGGQSPTYKVWHGMRQRCRNPNDQNYPSYGGRGVEVCERWDDFTNFLADMGERPAGMTIDRIDGAGHYEPSNCRWATQKQQCNNWTDRNARITYKGVSYTLQELSDKLGLNRYTLRRRIFDMKWPEEHWAEPPSREKRHSG